jgi:hypothetical protein
MRTFVTPRATRILAVTNAGNNGATLAADDPALAAQSRHDRFAGITRGDIPRLVDSLFPPQGPDPTGRLVSCVRPRSKGEFRNAA